MKSQGKSSLTLIKRFMHPYFEGASVKTQLICFVKHRRAKPWMQQMGEKKNQCTYVLPACQTEKRALQKHEAVQKHISKRTEIKQVQTVEIFTSTRRLPNLCIDSLITACSSECTREGIHRNNGTHSLDIVYFIDFSLCGWPAFFLHILSWLQDKICKKTLCVHMNYTRADNKQDHFFVFKWPMWLCVCALYETEVSQSCL